MNFQSSVFSSLTTSLGCPSVQGATVHKPRRRAATNSAIIKPFYAAKLFILPASEIYYLRKLVVKLFLAFRCH